MSLVSYQPPPLCAAVSVPLLPSWPLPLALPLAVSVGGLEKFPPRLPASGKGSVLTSAKRYRVYPPREPFFPYRAQHLRCAFLTGETPSAKVQHVRASLALAECLLGGARTQLLIRLGGAPPLAWCCANAPSQRGVVAPWLRAGLPPAPRLPLLWLWRL